MLLVFPVFNIYGSSLLLLSIQGLIFSFLLLKRYHKQRNASDLLLGLILLITCYHQTTYTIGFMEWYDTYRTTKVNYYLIDFSLALAPLLFFYIKSTIKPDFRLSEIRLWHFIPAIIYFLIKVFILISDLQSTGFNEVQNGPMVINFEWKYVNPFLFLFRTIQMLLYLAFSFQIFFDFREKIKHYFANTYKLELNWLQNFLAAYSFLYLFYSIQTVVNELIVDLSWIQEWLFYLSSGIAIIYVGIKGYFTKVTELSSIDFASFAVPANKEHTLIKRISEDKLSARQADISSYFAEHKPFLDPELTLISLSEKLDMSREELSDVINQGFESRFNDFINSYRIQETKRLIAEGKHKNLSLLGLAFEAGFNSKATFNRAFKKSENQSPSEYLNQLSK
ncbi:MAG: AraC family transcriptional regulator [Ekhidna sp.]